MAKGINIKFPFKDTYTGGIFQTNKTTANALKDDMISLLTTRRGHRVMRSSLYSPIYDYIMEQMDDYTKKQLETEIIQKVAEFIPQITITKVLFEEDFENNVLTIEIVFRVDSSFGVEDSVILNLPREHDSTSAEGDIIR
jgi:phage baseplate assembly protein W